MQPDQPDQVIYQRIVTYSDGQQILIQDAPGLSVSIDIDDVDIVDEQRLDHISQPEFEDLAEKAMTHDIQIDTISQDISVIPKETSMQSTSDIQIETPTDQGASKL